MQLALGVFAFLGDELRDEEVTEEAVQLAPPAVHRANQRRVRNLDVREEALRALDVEEKLHRLGIDRVEERRMAEKALLLRRARIVEFLGERVERVAPRRVSVLDMGKS